MSKALRRFWVGSKRLGIVVLVLALLGGTYYLMSPMSSTRVRVFVRAEAVAWDSADSTAGNPEWFGWALRGSVGNTYSQAPATIIIDQTGAHLDDRAPLDLAARPTSDTLQIEKLAYPPLAHLGLTQARHELRLTVSADTPYNAAPLQWEVLFRHRDYLKANSDSTIPLDRPEIPFRLVMRQHLRPGHEYDLTLTKPLPWKSPERVMARAVRFELTNASKNDIVSSVLSGTVDLLDVNNPSIALTERDVVKLEFAQPVELFLSGDGQAIEVRLDGLVSSIKCGPKIMGDDNERMPLHIQNIHDKRPYIANLLMPILAVLLGGLVTRMLDQSNEKKGAKERKAKAAKKKRRPAAPIVALAALLLAAAPAAGQSLAPWQRCAGSLAHLKATAGGREENGSGFVVGATADSVFIVTAGHVLLQPTATVSVWLQGQPHPLPARIRYFSYNAETGPDLGLVAVAVLGYHPYWPAFSTDPSPDDELWFVHNELAEGSAAEAGPVQLARTRMPRAGAGVLSSFSSAQHKLLFALHGVAPGDSGSALFATMCGEPVLVGMIIEKDRTQVAHDLNFIATTLRPLLGHRWMLPYLLPNPGD